MSPTRLLLLYVGLVVAARAQGTLTLGVATGPASFDAVSTAACPTPPGLPCRRDLVKTEPLTLTLTTTPTPVSPPPAILQPRKLGIWIGGVALSGFPLDAYLPGVPNPANLVFLFPALGTPGGTVVPAPVVDSFFDPFGPVFGPPLFGPSNTLTTTIGLDLPAAAYFLAAGGAPLRLVVQAIAEDASGSPTPILVSNAVELDVIDPEAAYAPQPGPLDPPSAAGVHPGAVRVATDYSATVGQTRAAGPLAGGDVLVVDGARFLAQSNWAARPTKATFVSRANPAVQATTTNVQILSSTRLAVTTPALPILAAPDTAAGFYDVLIENDDFVSPSSAPHAAAEPYLYRTGVAPTISGFAVLAGPNNGCGGPGTASPEGGDTLAIFGAHLLRGSAVRFTHLSLNAPTPGLGPYVVCPPASAFVGGTQLTVTIPPFCAGAVLVEVIAPDEEIAVAPALLVVCDLVPALSNVGPPDTLADFTPPVAYPTLTDTGDAAAASGAGLIAAASPLFSATVATPPAGPVPPATATSPVCSVPSGPTATAAALAPTRFELSGPGFATPLLLAPAFTSGVLTSLTLPSIDDEDEFRPQLGLKDLRAVNPPCAGAGGASVFSPPVKVLVQDDAPPTIAALSQSALCSSIDVGACGPASPPVAYEFTIAGANFFSTRSPSALPVGQIFDPLTGPSFEFASPPLLTVEVPAVKFTPSGGGGVPLWAPVVTLVSGVELRVSTPPAPYGAYDVTVVNPDGRSHTLIGAVRFVPRLTAPCALAAPAAVHQPPGTPPPPPIMAPEVRRFDALEALLTLDGATSKFAFPPFEERKFMIAPALNPTKFSDYFEELQNGSIPPEIAALGPDAYDVCLVFNTRRRGNGELRAYDFDEIDLPRTVNVTTNLNVADTTTGLPVVLPPRVRRLIVKAAAFEFDLAAGRFRWFYEESYPLVLRAKHDLRCDALVDLCGDALFEELGLLGGTTNAYRARHDWAPAPAGGGVGGRGGSFYCSQPLGSTPGANAGWSTSAATWVSTTAPGCLEPPPSTPAGVGGAYEQWGLDLFAPAGVASAVALPPIVFPFPPASSALGIGLAALKGAPGYPPQQRFDFDPALNATVYPPPYGGRPKGGGSGGAGVAPTGGQAGGGGGGGFATAGAAGAAGATTAALGGLAHGNASTYPPGSTVIAGRPSTDAFVYGGAGASAQTDFHGPLAALFAPPPPSGTAATQFPVPFLTGGAGGGGGGGSAALFVPWLSVGGRGGNGGGALVLLADRKIEFGAYGRLMVDGEEGRRGLDAFPIPNNDPLFPLSAPGSGGGGAGGLIYALAVADIVVPTPTFVTAAGGPPVMFGARGGKGGTFPGAAVPTANGGDGGAGRMRFAVNQHSSRGPDLETNLRALAAAGHLSITTPSATIVPPLFPPPPTSIFVYPSP